MRLEQVFKILQVLLWSSMIFHAFQATYQCYPFNNPQCWPDLPQTHVNTMHLEHPWREVLEAGCQLAEKPLSRDPWENCCLATRFTSHPGSHPLHPSHPHMSTVLPRSLPVWWGSAFPLHHSLLPRTERLKAQEEGVCPLVTLCCTHALNELSVRCFTTVLASTCCGLAGPALHLLLMCPLELVSLAAFKINLFISSRTWKPSSFAWCMLQAPWVQQFIKPQLFTLLDWKPEVQPGLEPGQLPSWGLRKTHTEGKPWLLQGPSIGGQLTNRPALTQGICKTGRERDQALDVLGQVSQKIRQQGRCWAQVDRNVVEEDTLKHH